MERRDEPFKKIDFLGTILRHIQVERAPELRSQSDVWQATTRLSRSAKLGLPRARLSHSNWKERATALSDRNLTSFSWDWDSTGWTDAHRVLPSGPVCLVDPTHGEVQPAVLATPPKPRDSQHRRGSHRKTVSSNHLEPTAASSRAPPETCDSTRNQLLYKKFPLVFENVKLNFVLKN